jgi:hypothetical protein
MRNNYITIPLSELTKPQDGYMVYVNRYWILNENNEAMFFRTYSSPQCNINKLIAERICNIHLNRKIQFLEIAYVPIVWSDYV